MLPFPVIYQHHLGVARSINENLYRRRGKNSAFSSMMRIVLIGQTPGGFEFLLYPHRGGNEVLRGPH